MPMGNGYAMVPMMYCPVVSGGNFSTPKTMLTKNNCFSDPTTMMNRNPATPKQLTPVRFQKAVYQSADKACVKRALNYSKCTKKTKSRIKKPDNTMNYTVANTVSQTSHLDPAYTTETFTEVIASGQATKNNPVKTVCTPVKNIMNEFGITSINSDNFNVPFTSLMKDLPSPSKFPHLIPSPLKKQKSSFQGLVTPTKSFEKEIVSKLPSSLNLNNNNDIASRNNCQQQNFTCVMSTSVEENTCVTNSTKSCDNTIMKQSYSTISHNISQSDSSKSIISSDEMETIDTSILVQTHTPQLKDSYVDKAISTAKDIKPTPIFITSVSSSTTLNQTVKTSVASSHSRCSSDQTSSSHTIISLTVKKPEPKVTALATTSNKLSSHSHSHFQPTLPSPNVSNCVPVSLFPNPPSCLVMKREPEEKLIDTSSSSFSSVKAKTVDTSIIQMNDNDNINGSLCTNYAGTGDDESSLDGGGMDSQTDDNASEYADEVQEKRDPTTSNKKNIPTDKSDNKKDKSRKRSNKNRRKAKRKNLFNKTEKLQQKVQDFARMYLNLVKTTLADNQELLEQFTLLMQEGSSLQLSKLQTYYKVASLFQDYPDLIDNFSAFLDQHEARHVGKVHFASY